MLQNSIMNPLKWFRNSVVKKRRLLCIFSLSIGLYFLFTFVLSFKKFNVKTPIKAVAWLKFVKVNSTASISNHGISQSYHKHLTDSRVPRHSTVRGFLNCHIWTFACKPSLQQILQNPLFPISPNVQQFVDSLEMQRMGQKSKDVKGFGKRIFGFIFAPVTGRYKFSMLTSCDAEVWLSMDRKWQSPFQLVCKSGQNNVSTTESNMQNSSKLYSSEIQLSKDQFYFIEISLAHVPENYFYLNWRLPNSEKFEEISKKYLYPFMKESSEFKEFIKDVPLTPVMQSYINNHPQHSILSSTRKLLSGVKYAEWHDVKLALPVCHYQPGYVGKRVLHQYYAVEHFVNPSYVYPEVKHPQVKEGKWDPWFPLSKNEALSIVETYMKHLQDAYNGKYRLKKILNVERKPDWDKSNTQFYKGTLKHGDRFFLEMLLWDNTKNEEVILSEYVYQYKKNNTLCYPEGMQWNRRAPLYFLISVRKQAAWVWHFLKNVEQIYQTTADENLHVILYDYNSTNIDIEGEFQKSSFKNYKILKHPDSKYSRAGSLNSAAKAVTDPNAIVFTLDLHLQIPPTFANNVRKHCIKGKMVYTPIIKRLSCGASPRYLSGAWDPWGYGMFGAYKVDWDTFKGFDEVKFKTKWGGEDWDLVNRAYVAGLEFDRIKHADFYHFDHTRVGMWT